LHKAFALGLGLGLISGIGLKLYALWLLVQV